MSRKLFTTLAGLILLYGCSARKPGSPLTPGFNVYSKEQDIELGRQAAQEVRQEMDVVQNDQLQNYLDSVGKRLAMTPSAGDYPYSFTVLNDKSINAFALPGGPTFVNSGLIAAAKNEAQLAGVMAHEIGHVALRHGTSQASKANLLSVPAQLAGALFGEGTAGQLGQAGVGLGLNLLMLRYSRSAETEADAIATHIMSEAGYDPTAMAQFFQTLEQQGGSQAPEFLSDHPNPGNRMQAVQAEARTLQPRTYEASRSDRNFEAAQQIASALPAPSKTQQQVLAANAAMPPQAPAGQFERFEGQPFTVEYPSNWQSFSTSDSQMWVMAPRQGLVRSPNGNVIVGYGMLASYFPAQNRSLEQGTQELLQQLRKSDPQLQVTGNSRSVNLNGKQGLVTPMAGTSPYGGQESNYLLTVARPEGLFYLVFVVPPRTGSQAQGVFDHVINSLQFRS